MTLFPQDIAEMFVTVGMCEEAVTAYVKVGISLTYREPSFRATGVGYYWRLYK